MNWGICNEATLEVIYETRNCARYTLASQLILGLPNYYYEGFFKQLNNPSINGYEAAIAIMESERADMYHTLTLVDNQVVKHIPAKLSQLIQSLLNNRLHPVDFSTLRTIYYFDEQCCDVLTLFGSLAKNFHQTSTVLAEFEHFLKSSVIASHKTGGEIYGIIHSGNQYLTKFCGLSLYLPETRQEISRYSSLSLYQKVDLVSLYKRIIIS